MALEGDFEDKIKKMFSKRENHFLKEDEYEEYIKQIIKLIEFSIFEGNFDLITCAMVSLKSFFPSLTQNHKDFLILPIILKLIHDNVKIQNRMMGLDFLGDFCSNFSTTSI